MEILEYNIYPAVIINVYAGEIHPEDSLFTYPADTTAQNFSNPDHIPVFLSDIMESASPEILEACGGNPECVFDYAATGNPEIGLGTLSANINNTQDQEEACKDLPFDLLLKCMYMLVYYHYLFLCSQFPTSYPRPREISC